MICSVGDLREYILVMKMKILMMLLGILSKMLTSYSACFCSIASMRGVGVINHSTACCKCFCIDKSNAKSLTFTLVNLFFWRWRRMSLKVFWSDKPSLSDQPRLDIVLRSNYLWAKFQMCPELMATKCTKTPSTKFQHYGHVNILGK